MATELDLEIAMLRQAVVASRVRETLGQGNSRRANGPMSHGHHCQHCDVILHCSEADCTLPYDLSNIHRCGERQTYLHRMRRLLGRKSCKYGCSGDCAHPRKDVWIPQEEQWEYMRPKVVQWTPHHEPVRFVKGRAGTHSEECLCPSCKRAFRRGDV